MTLAETKATRCDWSDDDDVRCHRDALVRVPEFGDVQVCAEHAREFEPGVLFVTPPKP